MEERLTRSTIFTDMGAIVELLPFVTDKGKHYAASKFFSNMNADIVLAQECRGLAYTETILDEFHPPFTGTDEYTAVFLRKNLPDGVNVSAEVRDALLKQLMGGPSSDGDSPYSAAWKTTCNRISAVKLNSVPRLGGKSVIAASLHCSFF